MQLASRRTAVFRDGQPKHSTKLATRAGCTEHVALRPPDHDLPRPEQLGGDAPARCVRVDDADELGGGPPELLVDSAKEVARQL